MADYILPEIDEAGNFTSADVLTRLDERYAGGGGATTMNDLIDVDTATAPPAVGQTILWDGAVWKPGTVEGGSGGGTYDPDTMVFRGVWSPGSYPVASVVKHDGATWVATTVTSATPESGELTGSYSNDFQAIPFEGKWAYAAPDKVSITNDVTTNLANAGSQGVSRALMIKTITSSSNTATLSLTFNAPGTLTFAHAVSCEGTYDKATFLVDGVQQYTGSGPNGTWVSRTVNVSAGNHVFEWRYTKDTSGDSGRDAYFLSNLTTTNAFPSDDWTLLGSDSSPTGGGSGGEATTLDLLSDVDTSTTAPTLGQTLVWDGTNWVPGTIEGGAGGGGSSVLVIDQGGTVPAGTPEGTIIFERTT